MSNISPINNSQSSKPLLTPKNTGYAAGVAMVFTTIRALNKSKPIIKSHKTLGWITAGLTALHIGVTEYYHHKFKLKK